MLIYGNLNCLNLLYEANLFNNILISRQMNCTQYRVHTIAPNDYGEMVSTNNGEKNNHCFSMLTYILCRIVYGIITLAN
jgi:hypothetical protein